MTTATTGASSRWIARLVPTVALLLGAAGGLAGCGALDVSDPTAIEESELDDAAGAELLRGYALRMLYIASGGGALASGLMADEYFADPPSWYQQFGFISEHETLDRRESAQYEQLVHARTLFGSWHDARHAAAAAMVKLRAQPAAADLQARVGEMFAVRGFATLRLAEDICPGFPLHDIVDYQPIYGPPLTTDEAFEQALADLDSAVVYGADSSRIVNFARVGQARALLGLGRVAEAAAAALAVPTDYVLQAEFSASVSGLENPLAFGVSGDRTRSVADQEGDTGLDFVEANDPRVQTASMGTANDGVTGVYRALKYPDESAPLVLANGIEARLIEAEAALQDGGDWLGMLNALRTDGTFDTQPNADDPAQTDTLWHAGSGGVAGLAPLADPGSAAAQQDLLFRERAFWLFGTGHRLGDLRRLVRHYGRTSETVFPTGTYRLGGSYGAATSIPFPGEPESQVNPSVTGCTSR